MEPPNEDWKVPTGRISFRISPERHKELLEIADALHFSLSDLLIGMIDQSFDQYRKAAVQAREAEQTAREQEIERHRDCAEYVKKEAKRGRTEEAKRTLQAYIEYHLHSASLPVRNRDEEVAREQLIEQLSEGLSIPAETLERIRDQMAAQKQKRSAIYEGLVVKLENESRKKKE
jgi:hypothetical protein